MKGLVHLRLWYRVQFGPLHLGILHLAELGHLFVLVELGHLFLWYQFSLFHLCVVAAKARLRLTTKLAARLMLTVAQKMTILGALGAHLQVTGTVVENIGSMTVVTIGSTIGSTIVSTIARMTKGSMTNGRKEE